jgi:hypothetical protein
MVWRWSAAPASASQDRATLGSVHGSRYSAISASLAGRPSALTTEMRHAARTSSRVVAVVRLEVPGLLIDDVPGEIEHVLGDFDVLDVVEILLRIAHFIRISQQRPHQALVEWLERDDVFAVRQHHASDRDLVHFPNGFANDREGVMANLAVRTCAAEKRFASSTNSTFADRFQVRFWLIND